MASSSAWHRSQKSTSDQSTDDLLVFGYSCKMFRDDEKATFIDEGKHLIPWMGDESLMIDRYDARGYLHDLHAYEPKTYYETDKEIVEEEALCDEERYLALRSDVSEEELYHEEEMKRLRAAVASDGAYHEIGFSYDSVENTNAQTQLPHNKDIEPVEEPYVAPEGLKIPKGMQVPSNMKIHAIIEKTAFFISQQGGQMEVIIRMKQSSNPQFAFMCFDNPLHPYYKFLVSELKAGRYKPIMEKKSKETDDDHPDGHYLHPSLVSRKAEDIPKFTVPSINFRRTGDDSYSLLVKNLKQSIDEDNHRNSPTTYLDTGSPIPAGVNSRGSTSDSDDSSVSENDSSEKSFSPPPPNIQSVIDKMAEYVAKNGEDFEIIVKSKHDKRFDFLNHGHKYYSYYTYRKNSTLQRIAKVSETCKTTSSSPEAPVSHSVTAESKHPTPSSNSSLPVPQAYVPDCAIESYSSEQFRVSSSVSSSGDPEIQTSAHVHMSPKIQSPKSLNDCEPDTPDAVKSSGSEIRPKEEVPVKAKILKGPISFSLKAKELEPQNSEKVAKRAPLLLDDSEGDDEKQENESSFESDRRRKGSKDHDQVSSSHSRKFAADEEKPRKPTAEELEAKLAEEKIKSKIMAAAREKLVQQKRDKQLQLERKQKAALFLQMLQAKKLKAAESAANAINENNAKSGRSTTGAQSNKNGSSPSSPDIYPDHKEAITSFPPSPLSSFHHGKSWSPASDSELSEPENTATTSNERLQASSVKEEPKPKEKISQSVEKSHKSRSKSHKSSKSKKRKRSRSHSSSRHRRKIRSPSRKEKKLPSAYALERRSRSRSHSPKRYSLFSRGRSPQHWSRCRP